MLKPFGTLIFKWNEYQVSISEIRECFPAEPIFGNKRPGLSKTHWLVFFKACAGRIDKELEEE